MNMLESIGRSEEALIPQTYCVRCKRKINGTQPRLGTALAQAGGCGAMTDFLDQPPPDDEGVELTDPAEVEDWAK